jgi:transcriptional regulator with XRE-family HTH domain
METIEQRVAFLRKEGLGLSQTEFAKKMGLKQSVISQWEVGITPLNEKNIKMIALIFHVSEHWLRTGEGEMFMPDSSKLEEELFQLFRQLTPEMQDVILEHVKNLLHIQQTLRKDS